MAGWPFVPAQVQVPVPLCTSVIRAKDRRLIRAYRLLSHIDNLLLVKQLHTIIICAVEVERTWGHAAMKPDIDDSLTVRAHSHPHTSTTHNLSVRLSDDACRCQGASMQTHRSRLSGQRGLLCNPPRRISTTRLINYLVQYLLSSAGSKTHWPHLTGYRHAHYSRIMQDISRTREPSCLRQCGVDGLYL